MRELTWLVLHSNNIETFLEESIFFEAPLLEILKIKSPFNTLHDCKDGYEKAGKFIRKRSTSFNDKYLVISCFSLSISKFLIQKKNLIWKLNRGFCNTVYYEPVFFINNKHINPIWISTSCLAKHGKISFEFYYWQLTETSYNDLSMEMLNEKQVI